MADDADFVQQQQESDIQRALAQHRAHAPRRLTARGACHFCAEPLATDALFCNASCRKDWERVSRAAKFRRAA